MPIMTKKEADAYKEWRDLMRDEGVQFFLKSEEFKRIVQEAVDIFREELVEEIEKMATDLENKHHAGDENDTHGKEWVLKRGGVAIITPLIVGIIRTHRKGD